MESLIKCVDSLRCSICLENYDSSDHKPVVLPCQHTFCVSCIESVAEETLPCPLCRRCVALSEVSINSRLSEIVGAREKLRRRCSHHEADCRWICMDCSQPLCAKCVRELDKAHKCHKIVELAEVSACYPVFSELMDNALRCDLCREQYDSSDLVPKVLPCHCRICRHCANGLTTCPCCRIPVLPTEIMTNHVIRDMIEGKNEQTELRVFCQYHKGKECTLACMDCCIPVCTECMSDISIRHGIHEKHNFDDMDDAIKYIKNKLDVTVEEKMTHLESESERILNGLMAESAQHTKDVDAVVQAIISSVCAWREGQLEKKQKRVRVKKSLQDAETIPALVEAKKAIEKNVPIQEEHEINDVKLTGEALDQLRLTMDCLMKSIIHKKQNNWISTNPDKTVVVEDVVANMGDPCLEGASGGHDPQTEAAYYVPRVIQSASVCPNCNKHTPLYPDRLANLHNSMRNNRFLRVVADERRRQQKLICQTDDFIYVVELDSRKEPCVNFVYGVWEERSQEKLLRLRKLNCVLGYPMYRKLIRGVFHHWQKTLFNLRAGCLSQNKQLHSLHL